MVTSSRFPILRGSDVQQSRVQDNVSALVGPVAKALQNTPIMGGAPPAWIAPNRLSALADLLGGYHPLGYHRDALGYVHVTGGVASATGVAAGTTAFVLAQGYRPAYQVTFMGTTATVGGIVDVTPDGRVTMVSAVAAGGYYTFEFSFLAEG